MIDPFGALEARPIWVAWREEVRGSARAKPTKVPYDPNVSGSGFGYGSSTDPATWGTHVQAETRARQLDDGRKVGCGTVLGDLGDGTYLSGADLDSSLDENGALASWAVPIVEVLRTYAEISPSGRGLKTFFRIRTEDVRWFLDQIGVEKDAWGCKRGIPGLDGANHGPGIEIYTASRYFTVTGQSWSVDHPHVVTLDRNQLAALAALIPSPAGDLSASPGGAGGASGGAGSSTPAPHNSRDSTRSARAARIAIALMPDTYEEMCEGLRQHIDPDIKAWVEDKGEAHSSRELKRIWKRIAAKRTDTRLEGLADLAARAGIETSDNIEPDQGTPEPKARRANGHAGAEEEGRDNPSVETGDDGKGGELPPPPSKGGGGPPLPPPPVPPDQAIELGPDGVPIDYSEEWLTLEFSRRHRRDLRHLALFGRWYWWRGTHWGVEHTLKVFDFARKVVRAASAEIKASMPNGARLSSVVASAKTVAAIERLARADRRHATEERDWDRNLETFVTATATIELKTGAIRKSRREDMNTKIAAVHADPRCRTPLWTAFLDTITAGDVELQKYLQRMTGYCMTGLTIEHVLFFLYGTGANGKGVFLGTIGDIFADYAAIAPIELFFETQGERHPTELAHLWGARLALAQENERNRHWAEAKLKALTGGDKITARFMRQDFFDFIPRFKLVIAGNHKPSLRGVDEAIRRRLHLVPFIVTIPPEDRDPHLREKLKAEWPGILWWMAKGAVDWYRIGLAPPQAVVDASEKYFIEEDRLGLWLEECCTADPQAMTLSSTLFKSWEKWSTDRHERPGSHKAFSQALEKRFDKVHDRTGWCFIGLRRADDPDTQW